MLGIQQDTSDSAVVLFALDKRNSTFFSATDKERPENQLLCHEDQVRESQSNFQLTIKCKEKDPTPALSLRPLDYLE